MSYFSTWYQADCQLCMEGEIQQYVTMKHTADSLVKTDFYLSVLSCPSFLGFLRKAINIHALRLDLMYFQSLPLTIQKV